MAERSVEKREQGTLTISLLSILFIVSIKPSICFETDRGLKSAGIFLKPVEKFVLLSEQNYVRQYKFLLPNLSKKLIRKGPLGSIRIDDSQKRQNPLNTNVLKCSKSIQQLFIQRETIKYFSQLQNFRKIEQCPSRTYNDTTETIDTNVTILNVTNQNSYQVFRTLQNSNRLTS